MLKQFLQKVKIRHLQAWQEEKGQSLIIFTFAFLGLIAMLGLALDLGLVYIEQVRVGRTSDAATLAAVVELPSEEEAIRRAIEFIELNGYEVGPTGNTKIIVRGCVSTLQALNPVGAGTVVGNVNESGSGAAIDHASEVITPTTVVTGATLALYDPPDPLATFMVDTYSYQASTDGNCDPANNKNGDAQKIQVRGQVNVRMNFMQFFGFPIVPVEDVAVAENITNLDVMVVFDVSGSMESETTCYDCWVRTDPDNHDYPNNGYFNPLPYNPEWADTTGDSIPDVPQAIPLSDVCVAAPAATVDGGRNFLVHEAELYSHNSGNWNFNARTQGQGFWVLQRGSRNLNNQYNPNANDDGNTYQGNQAGSPSNQSSNVCDPGVAGAGPQCTINGDDICGNDGGIDVDCSAYIATHPFTAYTQREDSDPKLQGGVYDLSCFTSGDGTCWTGNTLVDPTRPNETLVPYVEYDFTIPAGWITSDTHIWIRARGGGDLSTAWNGLAPNTLDENYDDVVLWQVMQGSTEVSSVAENRATSGANSGWRDNRIIDSEWQWIKLGSVSGTSVGVQYTLRVYQGSAGYKIDKIVFTDNTSGSAPSILSQNGGKGPPATNGSATREACNVCNPAYGYEVTAAECNCPVNATEAAAGPGSGTGTNCTAIIGSEAQNQLENDLYNGIEPLRSAQEAVKDFAKRLDTDFDQIGIAAFTFDAYQSTHARSIALQCKRADPDNCENNDDRFLQALRTIERQWPTGGTDIADGMLQGLTQLGVEPYAINHDCNTANARSACDRIGARKILILITDGSPNNWPSSCGGAGGSDSLASETIDDLWNGDVGDTGGTKRAYECSMHYARKAAQAGVIVYTIGLGGGVNADLLTAMAEGRDPHSGGSQIEEIHFSARGGQFFNASTPKDLETIFTQILGNIYVRIL